MLASYLLLGVTLFALPASPETVKAGALHAEAHPAITTESVVQGNSINGHVFDSSRRPIERLYVELMNDYYQTLARTRTDSSGLYSFNNLSPGNFKVKVLSTGTDFIEQTQDVVITNFGRRTATGTVLGGRDSQQLDFIMRSKSESRAAATNNGAPGTVFVQGNIPLEAKRAYEKAVEELDREKPDEAGLNDLKKAIDLFPNYYMALERLGTEYVKRGQFEPANIVLSKAVEVYPRGFMSLYSLGVTLYNLKRMDAAAEMLDRAVSVQPGSINTQLYLGMVLRQQSKYDQAEIHLKRANELGKGQVPEAHWQLALLYNHLKRNAEAANELEAFLKLEPDARDAEQIRKLIKRLRENPKRSASG